MMFICLFVKQLGSEEDTSESICPTSIRFGLDNHSTKRMIANDFGDPLTFFFPVKCI